jgi:hypothetical protein
MSAISLKHVRAGRAIFTTDNGKGEHFTFRVKASKPSAAWPTPAYFVQLLTGPENTSDYTYVGMLTEQDTLRLTAKSQFKPESLPVRVFNWTMRVLRGEAKMPEGYSVQGSTRCVRCGRLLTTPESIESGIGPECAGKAGF